MEKRGAERTEEIREAEGGEERSREENGRVEKQSKGEKKRVEVRMEEMTRGDKRTEDRMIQTNETQRMR